MQELRTNFDLLHDIFGDAQWTNKKRMSDEKLLDLIEHFSNGLINKNVPHDIMGDGYEYLIKNLLTTADTPQEFTPTEPLLN